MEELVLPGLSWVASPIVKKLITEASAYLSVDMVRELQQLEATVMPQFELVIQAAEKSPHRSKLEAWLRRLKEVFYDAEDLLDEHEYNLLKRKAKSGKDPMDGEAESSSIASTILKPLRGAKRRARNLLPENRKLTSKMNELKAILSEAKELHDLLGIPPGNTTGLGWQVVPTTIVPRTMTSLCTSQVFGRDKDRDRIVDFLLGKTTADDESSARYSSLAIVGAGGMGKSTLAQYVYNDKRIEEGFDVRMWVCISRKLDVRRHTMEIIESATKRECPCIDNLDTLQCKLHDILQKSEKFLLVLDDVWFEKSDSETEWFQLLDPLISKQSGSKVLVTSRRKTLPAALHCEQVVDLENMDDAEFFALFKHHAFSGEKLGDHVLDNKLEHAAEEIAKKLGQCPLVAKVLGSRLSRKRDTAECKAALKLNDLSEPFTSLLWSYAKLDPCLQRCFLYCSLFPKGHRYEPAQLVHLWVAEGFVDSRNLSSRTMEDVGRDYFNDMVSGSFFQQLGSSPYYVMHDILHDLAELLSREDCFRLEDDNVTEIPCTVRHLSVAVETMQKYKQIICKLHHLRTVICIDPLMDTASVFFDQMLPNLKKLRVLYLSFYKSSKLPGSVGELKHLRYLNLRRTFVSELPKSLCSLYHLQLLELNNMVKSLPDKFCNFSKLRYLGGAYQCQIPNIGKLTSLQQMHKFSVQKKQGYELWQLKDLNELGGSLTVENLENVSGQDEALNSMLHKKNRLKKLKLVWSCKNVTDAAYTLHLDILEGLRPPPQLSGLTIKGYKSGTYPRWLLEPSYFEYLENFKLDDCTLLEGLPNTEFLRHCSRLCLENVPKLKILPCLPAMLTKLSIQKCPLLMFVSKNELDQHDLRGNIMKTEDLASKLASLCEVNSGSDIREVLSEDYSSLKQLTTLMGDDISQHLQIIGSGLEEGGDIISVKENIIKAWLFCHEQRLRIIYGRTMELPLVLPSGLCELRLFSCSITDEALAICLGGLTSLRTLELGYNMALTTLPSEEVFQHLTKLEWIKITACWCLRSLGGLHAAPSLSSLHCVDCASLELAREQEFMSFNLAEDSKPHLNISVNKRFSGKSEPLSIPQADDDIDSMSVYHWNMSEDSKPGGDCMSPPSSMKSVREDAGMQESRTEFNWSDAVCSGDLDANLPSGSKVRMDPSGGTTMETPVSSSLGAMGPLLGKVDLLLTPKYPLRRSVKHAIQLLKEDLEDINGALVEQCMVDSPNNKVKYWMHEARELSYDVEDAIDALMLSHTSGDEKVTVRPVHCHRVGRLRIKGLPNMLKPLTRIARVTELRRLLWEARERHQRYELDVCISNPSFLFSVHSSRIPVPREGAGNLVGIDAPRNELTTWLTARAEQLKLLCIVGPAGVGKTALAKELYRELGSRFEFRAFVRVSRTPHMSRLLVGILSQIQGAKENSETCSVPNIIDKIRKHLQDKRYFIVIDGLWEAKVWDIIESAFPKGHNCSRIMIICEVKEVATKFCNYRSIDVFELKPLSSQDSEKLFIDTMSGFNVQCHDQLKEVSCRILRGCAGLPLATIAIAGLLASQSDNSDLWHHLLQYFFLDLANLTLDELLKGTVNLCYNILPQDLKTCLLYLTMYPEGCTIKKVDLLNQWIAEGFITPTTEGKEVVAENYFAELVNRGMIQPEKIMHNDEVLSCTVHHIVFDLIMHKSREQNFTTAVDYSQSVTEFFMKVYRLSLHFSSAQYATKLEGIRLSQIRSLSFFGLFRCMPSVTQLRLLRVLILEFWDDNDECIGLNLSRISGLVLLRYLKISSHFLVELPSKIQELKFLETLEIDARVWTVPDDIVHLPGLLHLSIQDEAKLPEGIGRVTSLQTLQYFDLGNNSEGNVRSLCELINLRDLHITCSTALSHKHLKRKFVVLAASLQKLTNLRCLTVAPGAVSKTMFVDYSSAMLSTPMFIQRLEFLPPICIFSRLPEWVGKLQKLRILKIVVRVFLSSDIDVLTGLPGLSVLSLYIRQPNRQRVVFSSGALPVLKYLKYTCGALFLSFQEEALPNLKTLKLRFNVHKDEMYEHMNTGIENLLNLKEMTVKIGAADGAKESDMKAAESAIDRAIGKHPRSPIYMNVRRIGWVEEE